MTLPDCARGFAALVLTGVLLTGCGVASRVPKRVGACRVGQVALDNPAQVGGITGTEIITVEVRDVTADSCTLRGYASIRLFATRRRRIAPLVVIHREAGPKEPDRVRTQLLVPHHRLASFDLAFEDHPSPEPASDCRRIAVVAARLPGQSGWLTAQAAIHPTDCMGKPLQVFLSPIGAAPAGS